MLVSFKVSNFLSINGEQELSMYPSRVTSFPEHKYKTKTTQADILKSAVIYGANSSGKSNLLKAIRAAQHFIVKGSENKSFVDVPVFKLNGGNNKPSSFVFEIYTNGTNYEFGFVIQKNIVVHEWLSKVSKISVGKIVYNRTLTKDNPLVEIAHIPQGDIGLVLEASRKELKNNQLFLTLLNSKNTNVIDEVYKIVFDWFENKLQVFFPNSKSRGIQLGLMKSDDLKDFFDHYLKILDTGIDHLDFEHLNLDDEAVKIPKDLKAKVKNELDEKNNLITISSSDGYDRYCIERKGLAFIAHKLILKHLSSYGELINFDLEEESDGTNRIFDLMPVLSMLMKSDKVILIDEIDRSLHSLIPAKIFDIFFKETIGKASQLIATTHDLNLLDLKKFRRDEIWFIRKNRKSESEIYSLEEFKIRSDKNLKNDYLLGLYGAIPILNRS